MHFNFLSTMSTCQVPRLSRFCFLSSQLNESSDIEKVPLSRDHVDLFLFIPFFV